MDFAYSKNEMKSDSFFLFAIVVESSLWKSSNDRVPHGQLALYIHYYTSIPVFHADQRGMEAFPEIRLYPDFRGHPHTHGGPQYQ